MARLPYPPIYKRLLWFSRRIVNLLNSCLIALVRHSPRTTIALTFPKAKDTRQIHSDICSTRSGISRCIDHMLYFSRHGSQHSGTTM